MQVDRRQPLSAQEMTTKGSEPPTCGFSAGEIARRLSTVYMNHCLVSSLDTFVVSTLLVLTSSGHGAGCQSTGCCSTLRPILSVG